jgi:hypothetical protein
LQHKAQIQRDKNWKLGLIYQPKEYTMNKRSTFFIGSLTTGLAVSLLSTGAMAADHQFQADKIAQISQHASKITTAGQCGAGRCGAVVPQKSANVPATPVQGQSEPTDKDTTNTPVDQTHKKSTACEDEKTAQTPDLKEEGIQH